MLAAAALWIQGEPHAADGHARAPRLRPRHHAVSGATATGGDLQGPTASACACRDRCTARCASWRFPTCRYTKKREVRRCAEYSRPFDLRGFDPKVWVTGEKNAWTWPSGSTTILHFPLVRGASLNAMLRRDPFERRVGAMLQYRRPEGAAREAGAAEAPAQIAGATSPRPCRFLQRDLETARRRFSQYFLNSGASR